jgi:putative ABC transport system permease protein
MNSIEEQENDLISFKAYIEQQRADENCELHSAVSAVQYTYDMDLLIYTKNVDGDIIRSDTQALMMDLMQEYYGVDMANMLAIQEQSPMGSFTSMMQAGMSLWQELLPGDNGKLISPLVENQNELIYGSWPSRYDEIVLFVDENNELDDLTLYALGLKSREEIDVLIDAAVNRTTVDYEVQSWSYEEICSMDFRTVLSSDCYIYDESTGTYTDLRETQAGLKYLYDNGLTLHVVGIAKPAKDSISKMISGSIGYTGKLTEYIINQAYESDVVQAQMNDPSTDIFTGLPFKDSGDTVDDTTKAADFRAYINALVDEEKAAVYIRIMSIPSEETVQQTVSEALGSIQREQMEATLIEALAAQTGMDSGTIENYINSMSDEEIYDLFAAMIEEQVRSQYAAGVQERLSAIPSQQLASMLDMALEQYTEAECAALYDDILEFSDSTYEDNLIALGCVDMDSPSSINLYASTFADKDTIENAIAAYNDTVDDLQEIKYTDYVGLMMSSITTIINAITYVLIAFVSVSLVVSSIMIGVITLISVQERTKEIGILRAIGASKKNVSSMFNAETVIIGFTSGTLGVLITYLLVIPINAILHHLTGIGNLSAYLPPQAAAVLVLISMCLTLFAGIVPSRSAAKKDPVVALRTE